MTVWGMGTEDAPCGGAAEVDQRAPPCGHRARAARRGAAAAAAARATPPPLDSKANHPREPAVPLAAVPAAAAAAVIVATCSRGRRRGGRHHHDRRGSGLGRARRRLPRAGVWPKRLLSAVEAGGYRVRAGRCGWVL